jgi:hypothetical protein
MPNSNSPRPKRLWVAAIMNVVVAGITVVALVFMMTNDRVPVEVRPTATGAIMSGFLAAFLIATSLLTFLGYPKARWAVLGGALMFYGILLLQSLRLIVHPSEMLPEGSSPQLWANVIRNAIEISVNVWVFLSAKVVAFLRSADAPT